ncbi:unnamed protein product [Leptosia nina]|uniref:Uncharacterized protein n=1 Tax=Leptosia nina TaxID=320188 RepID=A0AAV1IXN8_9NEOP
MKAIVATIVLLTYFSVKCSDTLIKTKELQKSVDNFDLSEVMSECNETFRIEMSYIDSINSTGSFPDEMDKTPKCFIRCMLEKYEVTSDGEDFDVDKTVVLFSQMKKIGEDDARDIVQSCGKRCEYIV